MSVSITFCVLQYTITAGITNVAIMSQFVSAHYVLEGIDITSLPEGSNDTALVAVI